LFIDSTQQVIGQLWGGPSSCTSLIELDYYGRFDVSYVLIASYLDPGSPCVTPDTPSGVNASDGSYSDRLRVTWGAASGATSYRVYRNSTNNAGSAQQLTQTTGTSYDDFTAAAPGTQSSGGCGGASTVQYTTYYYWVAAMSFCAQSPFGGPDTGYRGGAKSASQAGLVSTADGALANIINIGVIVLILYGAYRLPARSKRPIGRAT
jgi:hypothetical protein